MKGIRRGGAGPGRGRRGGGGHPSGLTGKEIGLWYAARGKEKKKKRELTEVSMSDTTCKQLTYCNINIIKILIEYY